MADAEQAHDGSVTPRQSQQVLDKQDGKRARPLLAASRIGHDEGARPISVH
ncbi:hypothetical protein IVB16_31910 [Bradyrhizobium sp. 183]|uniref:hypothetical protein n=1 Tax=unclassified Bradyrhizobium TaxID=2631580 RepID=UPI001FFF9902|nr:MULTISPECIES: hypothetical protein [unclassified Bradyrhizobium]UPJ79317.1 hypothetical protein IVB17_31910 [Bradyrhizobium sp. 184]UPJ87111.1 hypothetical protein IVB16_31910 [Bradyrhizobium sp. 183]